MSRHIGSLGFGSGSDLLGYWSTQFSQVEWLTPKKRKKDYHLAAK
jgi:hypothetical protein